MLRKHRARVVVNFYLPLNLEASPLKPEVEPADPREQRPHGQRPRH